MSESVVVVEAVVVSVTIVEVAIIIVAAASDVSCLPNIYHPHSFLRTCSFVGGGKMPRLKATLASSAHMAFHVRNT
jgi:hypothetical protein